MTVSIIDIIHSTSVDGPGLRTTVYAAGCGHHCPGCHNPQTWDIQAGHPINIDSLTAQLLATDEEITFSGGDPLFQAEAFGILAKNIKQKSGKNIWCYTGYTIEQIIDKPRFKNLLDNIDVLVDGQYKMAMRNPDLLFRGSENQRIIDVQSTLKSGSVILFKPNTTSRILTKYINRIQDRA